MKICTLCLGNNLRIKSNFCSKLCYNNNWKRINPERARLHRADVYLKNKDKYLATQALRHAANPELYRERVHLWKLNNKDKVRLQWDRKSQRRRARLRDAFVEVIDRNEVYISSKGVCGICHLSVGEIFTIDHIIPLAKGGLHERNNVQLAHAKCNSVKGDRYSPVG